MSLITRLFRLERKSLASPEDQLAEIFGLTSTASGVALSAEGSLCVPAVSSAVRVISEAAASLDIIGDGAVNHQVDTEPVAVFIKASGGAVGAFSRVVDGKTLIFEYKQDS